MPEAARPTIGVGSTFATRFYRPPKFCLSVCSLGVDLSDAKVVTGHIV